MKITKIKIAQHQLEQACELLLNKGDQISILTLAGAAEEILGIELRRQGGSNAIQGIHDAEKGADPSKSLKQSADEANRVRNAVKHFNNPTEIDVEFVPLDAYIMLARALENYATLESDLSEPMQKALYEIQTLVPRQSPN